MDATFLASISGVILSMFFGYAPGLSTWFDGLDAAYKRLIMAGLLFAVASGSVGLACSGYGTLFGVPVTCDQVGVVATIKAFVAAFLANQSAFVMFKKSYRQAY